MAKRNSTQTAAQAYKERAAQIRRDMAFLENALEDHRRTQKARPTDWGFVGDLGHVRELLAQINEFLGVPPESNDPRCDHADGCCRTMVGLPCDEN